MALLRVPGPSIDTHHHILPDFFWRETNDSHAPVGGLAPLQWSKEAMISFMDDAGIDVAVTSVSTPGVHFGDSGKARSLARRCNELAAEIDHVLFGTDFPYLRRDLAVNAKQHILQSSELNDLEGRGILGGNAARLFPRLHSLVPYR